MTACTAEPGPARADGEVGCRRAAGRGRGRDDEQRSDGELARKGCGHGGSRWSVKAGAGQQRASPVSASGNGTRKPPHGRKFFCRRFASRRCGPRANPVDHIGRVVACMIPPPRHPAGNQLQPQKALPTLLPRLATRLIIGPQQLGHGQTWLVRLWGLQTQQRASLAAPVAPASPRVQTPGAN